MKLAGIDGLLNLWGEIEPARDGIEYLLRGGFPQTALVESITQAQKLFREDIAEKMLKRDMTAPFGCGKEILRARYKVYLADSAIAPSVLPLCEASGGAMVLKIPAPLACYWLGCSEVENADKQ